MFVLYIQMILFQLLLNLVDCIRQKSDEQGVVSQFQMLIKFLHRKVHFLNSCNHHPSFDYFYLNSIIYHCVLLDRECEI